MQLVIVINFLDNCLKKVVELTFVKQCMEGWVQRGAKRKTNKRQRQNIREKKMALCMGGKKKEKGKRRMEGNGGMQGVGSSR